MDTYIQISMTQLPAVINDSQPQRNNNYQPAHIKDTQASLLESLIRILLLIYCSSSSRSREQTSVTGQL